MQTHNLLSRLKEPVSRVGNCNEELKGNSWNNCYNMLQFAKVKYEKYGGINRCL